MVFSIGAVVVIAHPRIGALHVAPAIMRDVVT